MPYVSIGDITLEVYEYHEHSEEHSFIYARQNTIYPPSTTQWMGQELKKISLKARLHAMLTDADAIYQKLTEIAKKGEAQKLIIAEQVKGQFVMDKVKANYLQMGAGGKAVALELELELTEYIQKELRKTKAKTQKQKAKTTQAQKTPQQKRQPKAIIRAEGASKK